ncbi:hypothetical protein BY996DRAFT_6565729 [Phakopsora pachyrhizi]|nr:hypothetical protein BY996DRAFT_6565729 [Phakopsora pachyrhizi]
MWDEAETRDGILGQVCVLELPEPDLLQLGDQEETSPGKFGGARGGAMGIGRQAGSGIGGGTEVTARAGSWAGGTSGLWAVKGAGPQEPGIGFLQRRFLDFQQAKGRTGLESIVLELEQRSMVSFKGGRFNGVLQKKLAPATGFDMLSSQTALGIQSLVLEAIKGLIWQAFWVNRPGVRGQQANNRRKRQQRNAPARTQSVPCLVGMRVMELVYWSSERGGKVIDQCPEGNQQRNKMKGPELDRKARPGFPGLKPVTRYCYGSGENFPGVQNSEKAVGSVKKRYRIGVDVDIIWAGGGCVGRLGKVWWTLLDFKDEGMAPLEKGGKVRWGVYQGQNDWSKITGVKDL